MLKLIKTVLDTEHGDEPHIQDTVQILLNNINELKFYVRNRPIIGMVPRLLRDDSTSSFKPRELRDDSTSFFKPRVVSIGPLHRKDAELQESERMKVSFMDELLTSLSSNPEQVLKLCVQKLNDLIHRIKESYAEMEDMTDIELIVMMVTDSFFILQFLYDDSMISQDRLRHHSICLDLLQLENQIPFFVLQTIYDYTLYQSISTVSLTTMLLKKLSDFHPFGKKFVTNDIVNRTTFPDHILGLLHRSMKHPFGYSQSVDEDISFLAAVGTVHSATDLQKSGVHFKSHNLRNWSMGIDFKVQRFYWTSTSYKGTLSMPQIRIGDEGERVLRNFIAYEQLGQAGHACMMSYILAIKMLVISKKDLQVLVESRIIESLESFQYIIDLLDELTKAIVFKKFHYILPWKNMMSYSNSNLVSVRRTYFSGAWSYIASISGLVLFILTAIQTYCSIRAL